MCLIAWNWQPDSATPLLLLGNRDEFYARAATPVHWWEPTRDGAAVLAGKDLQAGGTWLGLNKSGRLAALTNYRTVVPARTNTPSRGELVAGFLQGGQDARDYLEQLAQHAGDYNPFNLLVFDGQQLMGLESRGAKVLTLQAGVGGVSNADFQTPWPKLTQLKARLQTQVDCHATDPQSLLPLLHDKAMAPDAALPQTGVPQALERILSAAFIASPDYGTRACSVIALHQTHAEFTEQSYDTRGLVGAQQLMFHL
jgi:uncharacterized protein with NRDE domain